MPLNVKCTRLHDRTATSIQQLSNSGQEDYDSAPTRNEVASFEAGALRKQFVEAVVVKRVEQINLSHACSCMHSACQPPKSLCCKQWQGKDAHRRVLAAVSASKANGWYTHMQQDLSLSSTSVKKGAAYLLVCCRTTCDSCHKY